MTVLIQDARSERYLAPEGQWTSAASEAEDFNSHKRAFAFARRTPVSDFNIVLYFPITGFSLRVDCGRNEVEMPLFELAV